MNVLFWLKSIQPVVVLQSTTALLLILSPGLLSLALTRRYLYLTQPGKVATSPPTDKGQ